MNLDPLIAYDDDPVANTVHHPYSAYNQGWDARAAGHGLDRNPYEDATREEYFWTMGWVDADEDGEVRYGDPAPPPSMMLAAGLGRRSRKVIP